VNDYGPDGTRRQVLSSAQPTCSLSIVPESWRRPDVLLLGGVAGEIQGSAALAFEAGVVGANAQGWVRAFGPGGEVSPMPWERPDHSLAGVHALFLSEHDLPDAMRRSRELLAYVPMIAITAGWRGVFAPHAGRGGAGPGPAAPGSGPHRGPATVFATAFPPSATRRRAIRRRRPVFRGLRGVVRGGGPGRHLAG